MSRLVTGSDAALLLDGATALSPTHCAMVRALTARVIPISPESLITASMPGATRPTLRVQISRLRKALEPRGVTIQRVTGYRLVFTDKTRGQGTAA